MEGAPVIDLQAVRARAAERLALAPGSSPASMANAANRLIEPGTVGSPISQLATLAAHTAASQLGALDDVAVRYAERLTRLRRWGWPEADALALAERLARRDRELAAGDADDQAVCVECSYYRPGRCGNHRRAGLFTPEVGRDLAEALQRCPGFRP